MSNFTWNAFKLLLGWFTVGLPVSMVIHLYGKAQTFEGVPFGLVAYFSVLCATCIAVGLVLSQQAGMYFVQLSIKAWKGRK